MFHNLPLFPQEASTIAPKVDALYLFLVGLTIVFSVLIAGLIIYFAVKFRRRSEEYRPRPMHGSLQVEIIWSVIPLIIALGIFAWGADLFFQMSAPPAGALDVYVVGKQWMWKFEHSTGQREINELHVPLGRAVKLTMASEDVIHSFFVPAFRVKADVIPGRYRTAWFQATTPGIYHLFCAEYCGTKHAGMGGSVIVMEPAQFQAWLAGGGGESSPAAAGEKLFRDLACFTCHRSDGTGRGPVLIGVFGKQVTLATGQTVTADESYIRESILNPQAKVVAGFQPVMPTFQGQISEQGLLELIAYIKTLSSANAALPVGSQSNERIEQNLHTTGTKKQ
jgi:cytochrome c oxidase subunit 2